MLSTLMVLAILLSAPPDAAMRADVDRLVAHAAKLETLWPWQSAIPEVTRVVRHGKAVAPLLLALLEADPDGGDWGPERIADRVQQQAALALCRIFGVVEECGHVYCNRASPERNREVRTFWVAKITEAR